MKKTLLVISCVLSALLSEGRAQSFWKGLDYSFRIGYSIGGTIPVGMPASIRQLNSFTLTNNLQLGADARYMWTRQWGASVGIRFENKGMSEDAEVKDYRMEIVRGGETLAGRFTGDVRHVWLSGCSLFLFVCHTQSASFAWMQVPISLICCRPHLKDMPMMVISV